MMLTLIERLLNPFGWQSKRQIEAGIKLVSGTMAACDQRLLGMDHVIDLQRQIWELQRPYREMQVRLARNKGRQVRYAR